MEFIDQSTLQKKLRCLEAFKNKVFVTTLKNNIHPGDSRPYVGTADQNWFTVVDF